MGRRSIRGRWTQAIWHRSPPPSTRLLAFGRLDILVNNAGLGPENKAEDVTEADYDLTFDVNVKGTFFASQAAGKAMIRQGFGRIVNLSSQAGFVALPTESVYCAPKAAISHLTKCLAVEWGSHGITVNAVAPTFIRTPGTEPALADPEFHADAVERIAALHRIGEPPDVAGAACRVPRLAGRRPDHRYDAADRRRLIADAVEDGVHDRPLGRGGSRRRWVSASGSSTTVARPRSACSRPSMMKTRRPDDLARLRHAAQGAAAEREVHRRLALAARLVVAAVVRRRHGAGDLEHPHELGRRSPRPSARRAGSWPGRGPSRSRPGW